MTETADEILETLRTRQKGTRNGNTSCTLSINQLLISCKEGNNLSGNSFNSEIFWKEIIWGVISIQKCFRTSNHICVSNHRRK